MSEYWDGAETGEVKPVSLLLEQQARTRRPGGCLRDVNMLKN